MTRRNCDQQHCECNVETTYLLSGCIVIGASGWGRGRRTGRAKWHTAAARSGSVGLCAGWRFPSLLFIVLPFRRHDGDWYNAEPEMSPTSPLGLCLRPAYASRGDTLDLALKYIMNCRDVESLKQRRCKGGGSGLWDKYGRAEGGLYRLQVQVPALRFLLAVRQCQSSCAVGPHTGHPF